MRLVLHRLSLAALLCCSILAASEQKSRQATIDLVLVDGLGGHLTGGEVRSFKSRETGHDLATRFHKHERGEDQTATKIPYGHYDLRLYHSGFSEVDVTVDVFEPDVYLQVSIRTAMVHIVPLGPRGQEISTVGIKSFAGDYVDLASKFKGGIATGVPYGVYDLKFENQASYLLPTRVSVFQPDVWLIVGFSFEYEGIEFVSPSIQQSGVIENIPTDEGSIYVRLVSLYFDCSLTDKVHLSGASGTFNLAGVVPDGKYLLTILGRSGVLDIREVELPSKGPLHFDLAQSGRLPPRSAMVPPPN